jgi:hypothetical protein
MHGRIGIALTVATSWVTLLAGCADRTAPPPIPAAVAVSAGDAQQGRVAATLAVPVAVRVADAHANPVANARVTWATSTGSVSPATSITDQSGVATAAWTLGTTAGGQTLTATVSGVNTPATFHATGLPDVAATFSASPDTVLIKALFDTTRLVLAARDKYGNTIAGVKAGWTLSATGVVTIDSSGTVVAVGNGALAAIGRTGALADTVIIFVDNIAPKVSIQSPTTQSTFATSAAQLVVSGVASDNVGVTRLAWFTDRGNSGTLGVSAAWAIPIFALVNGDTKFSVVASDRVGYADTARVTVTRNNGATFGGAAQLVPSGALAGQSTKVRVLVNFVPDVGVTVQSVELVEVNAAGLAVSTLTQVQDNGNLANGDDIQADGIYSGYATIVRTNPVAVSVRARANLIVGGTATTALSATSVFTVYAALTSAQVTDVIATQSSVVAQLDAAQPQSVGGAIAFLVQRLKATAAVKSVAQTSSTSLSVEYASGLRGGIAISVIGEQGGATERAAWNQAASGFAPDTVLRSAIVRIPIDRQTVGRRDSTLRQSFLTSADPIGDGTIRNRNVLIYDPSATEFAPNNKGDAVRALAQASQYHLTVTHLKDGAANVAALLAMPQYGLVVIDTHGGAGQVFLSGEVVTTTNAKTYESMVQQGQLRIFDHVVVRQFLGIFTKASERQVFGADASLIASLPSRFPNSVVFGSYCQGTQYPALGSAFTGQGAQTYLGWDESFTTDVGKNALLDVMGKFLGTAKNISEAYTAFKDPKNGATLRLVGSQTAHYTNGLVNGNFETGDLSGWTTVGDGRVINKLGPLLPTEGASMAIISTGLGFTTSSGSISQAFDLSSSDSKLEFRWNFLSEEFLEYIGSQYQDYFRVRLVTPSGTKVLFSKTIDQIAAGYALTKASPGIVFDQGDVYQTGWLTLSLDVSAYRGQAVTLIIETGDVGDSIYDTAVLLDAIVVKP